MLECVNYFIIENYLMDKKIVSLLTNNLRVIIPDFGAFIIRQQEPRIVVFNEVLKNNDGLLTDYIMKTEGVEEDIALQMLSDFTGHALKVLEAGGVFTIEGLGTLQKDKKGRLYFLQDKSPDIPEARVRVEEIIELDSMEPVPQSHTVEFNIKEGDVPVLETNNPVKPILTKQLTRWIFIFLAANIVIIVFFLFKDSIHNVFRKTKGPAVISQSVLDQLKDSMISAATDTVIYGEASDENVAADIPSAKEEDLKYYIVAGCFRDEINANELVGSLKNLGYKAEKFGKIGDLYAVSFASFTDKELAVKELARIRNEYHPDAWMTRF